MGRFTDTKLFQPAANYFRTHGVYTNLTPKTKKWSEFWKEERRRCLEGYTVNDVTITGHHYHYLNYFPIMRAVEDEIGGRKYKKREYDFPDFYDSDYDYFWCCEIARKGITKQDYEKLNLDVEIHEEDLEGQKQMVVLKARRKGYSYKNASMLCRNYYHIERSKNFVFAFDKKFLEGDGIFQKVLDGIAFIDEYTPYQHPKLVDRPGQMYLKSGYKEIKNGIPVDKGFQSMIQAISLKDNPDGGIGKGGDLILFEEMGKFPGLKTAWNTTHHTVKEGTDALGLMIAFGTGGTSGADFDGAENLFYEPKENDILRIHNKWDEGAHGTYCGFFLPIYKNLRGFIDEHGNSLVEKAKEYEEGQRKIRKNSKDSSGYSHYIASTPFAPREAIMSFDVNLFPTMELTEQKNLVEAKKLWASGVPGYLYEGEDGVKFKMDDSLKPVYKFPHSKSDDVTGCVVIYEAPYRSNGKVPKDMYIAVHDPYAQDTSADLSKASLGATYIIKRTNNLSPSLNECIVASYVGRPQTRDQYNRNLFLLTEYYNAKLGFENDRGDVYGYAKRHKKLHMLEEQFSFLDKKELQGRTRRPYGMNMNQKRKDEAEIYTRDWLLMPVGKDNDDNDLLVLHTIKDPALLEELIKYHKKGNFDRVSAIFVGMYHLKEKYNKKVKEIRDNKHEEFFNRMYYGTGTFG